MRRFYLAARVLSSYPQAVAPMTPLTHRNVLVTTTELGAGWGSIQA